MDSFPLFTQFPPEVRQHVWRCALAQQGWSFSRPRRVGGGSGLRLVGRVHRTVGQVCREARAVMKTTHTHLDGLGWINFARHLFFFREASADSALMQQQTPLLMSMQHAVLNPRGWPRLWPSVDELKARCQSLRSLVVVAPWFDPAAILAASPSPAAAVDALDMAPYEDWRSLFRTSPMEMKAGVASLVDAIDQGAAANAERNAQYRARLDRAVQMIPDDVDEMENAYGRTRLALQRLDEAFAGPAPPSLYLRTREELLR